MNKTKAIKYAMLTLAIINIADLIYTVLAIHAWNSLGINGINKELNIISRNIMQNYGISVWIILKCMISSICLLFFKVSSKSQR